jgi:hypothetical protein
MTNKPIVEDFIESNNMDYLFLLLANLEVNRLNDLPHSIKKTFSKKITEMALEHVAKNYVPDFIVEEEEQIDLDEE